MCPHGVSVALTGGEKHIGQVYSERGSDFKVGFVGGFGLGGVFAVVDAEAAEDDGWSREKEMTSTSSESGSDFALPAEDEPASTSDDAL